MVIVLLFKYIMRNTILYVILWIVLVWFFVISVCYFCNAIRLIFSTTKKAPYIPSFDRQLELMKQLKLKKNATIVDLGCGDGKALRFFSKYHGMKLADGFDINRFAILKWKYLNKRQWVSNVYLYRKNLFHVDLKKYDYIYVYLWESQMAVMEDWIWKEKNNNTVIISNTFQFIKHKPYEIIKNEKAFDSIFLYK